MSAQHDRTKLLLLVGIVLATGLSVYLHLKLAERRDEAATSSDSPTARAKNAMAEVERAIINSNYEKANQMLSVARAAIDEAISMRPDMEKLARSRLVIIRRQSQMAQRLSQSTEATRYAKEAVDVAAQLFQGRSTDEKARHDRIATAREYAAATSDVESGVDILRGAVVAVTDSTSYVPANGPLEAQLAAAWIDLARRESGLKRVPQAMSSARRAIEVAQRAREGQADPVTASSVAYDVIATATKIAEDLDQREDQKSFESTAIDILEYRAKLSPNEVRIPIAIAARLGRLADLLDEDKSHDSALKNHLKAVALMDVTLSANQGDQTVRLAKVRAGNALGSHYSKRGKNKKALQAYLVAVNDSEGLEGEGQRTRLITMGNYAQLLGRLDKVSKARKVAMEAYVLAQALSKSSPDNGQAREDQVSAGLRLARLLRAPPRANKRRARGVALMENERLILARPPTGRQQALSKGLDALIKELR